MRLKGQSHKLSEMLATRRAPSLDTDTAFLARHANAPVLGERARLAKEARKRGVNEHAVYMGELADRPYDPTGYVESKADVKRRRAQLDAKHDQEVQRWAERGQRKYLSPRLVEQTKQEMFQKDPSLRRVNQRELEQSIIDKHGT